MASQVSCVAHEAWHTALRFLQDVGVRQALQFWLMVAAGLGFTGCLSAWDVSGPWACRDDTCPTGFTCDDGVCCKPGGTPACPTLPAPNGTCPNGALPTLYYADRDGDHDGNPREVSVRCAAPVKGLLVLTGTDCDDTDPAIHLGGVELCNGRDDNCDHHIDEGLKPQQDYFLDADGDGFGEPGTKVSACAAPPGHVLMGGDCAPFDPTRHPDAPERCNGVDDDCDGVTDRLETHLADVGDAFACTTSQLGACREGHFQCVAQTGGGVQRVCQATLSASRDVCDGVDNDCDGQVDEAPDCGGPGSLVDNPDVVVSAQRIVNTGTLATQCQLGLSGNIAESALRGGTWGGTSAGYHVWSMAPSDGGTWDLSNPNATLRLAFTATASGAPVGDGAWGNPDPFVLNHGALNPVVYLCGQSRTDLMRYRLVNWMDGFKLNDTTFDRSLLLKAVGTSWLIGQGSGFDTTSVAHVEVIVQTQATAFTVTFAPDAGFSR